MQKLRVASFFAGIGGFDVGLEATGGFETKLFVEIDPHAQLVLKKHWPQVPLISDVKLVNGKLFKGIIDLICGGYPCTGHSVAGKQKGLENEESKLWEEYRRLIGEIKPKYVLIENSHNLRSTGLVDVLKDIWALGYNAEWSVVSGYSVGAPHQRERLYILAWRSDVSYCDPFRSWNANSKEAESTRGWWPKGWIKRSDLFEQARTIEPKFLRIDDGIPDGLHANHERIKQLGNAVVPAIVTLIGKQILETEGIL